jgi:hypothetical protein
MSATRKGDKAMKARKAIMKLRWKRTSKDVWKSQTVAKRRYEIFGPRAETYTRVVSYSIACFAVARSSGRWYVRYIYDVLPRDLKEAKALAQAHANGERIQPDPSVIRAKEAYWARSLSRIVQSDMERERMEQEHRRRFIADIRASNTAALAKIKHERDALATQLGYADGERVTLH